VLGISADITVDQVLDTRGLSCPFPILKTKKAVEALSKYQVLKVETTDPGSKNDMAAWARRTRNELVKIEEGLGLFIFFIKKRIALKATNEHRSKFRARR